MVIYSNETIPFIPPKDLIICDYKGALEGYIHSNPMLNFSWSGLFLYWVFTTFYLIIFYPLFNKFIDRFLKISDQTKSDLKEVNLFILGICQIVAISISVFGYYLFNYGLR